MRVEKKTEKQKCLIISNNKTKIKCKYKRQNIRLEGKWESEKKRLAKARRSKKASKADKLTNQNTI